MNFKVRLAFTGVSERDLAAIARVSRGKDLDAASSLEDDKRTIETLLKLGHLSVFEFADLIYLLDVPIFVARQLMRYRSASYLERSLRYCEPVEVESEDLYDDYYNCSVETYREFIGRGERKEEARRVLTLDCPTRIVMKVNLRELLHICDERLAPTAQNETRDVVQEMLRLASEKYPTVCAATEPKGI